MVRETREFETSVWEKKGVEIMEAMQAERKRFEVPIWEKSNLTVDEAAVYFNIGKHRIKELSDDDDCPFVIWVGSKRLIKRKKFEEFLEGVFSI